MRLGGQVEFSTSKMNWQGHEADCRDEPGSKVI